MRKFNSSLSNKEQNGFIKKVMLDKNIHEIWEAAHNNEDESATSIICDLRG